MSPSERHYPAAPTPSDPYQHDYPRAQPTPDVAAAYMPHGYGAYAAGGFGPQVIGPEHLNGCVPVSLGKRVGARLLDSMIMGFVTGVALGVAALFGIPLEESAAFGETASLEAYLVGGVVSLVFLAINAATGWWPGSRLVGVRTVAFSEPSVPGGRAVGKRLLSGLAGCFCSLPWLIIVFATRDENERHAIDRASNIIVLDVKRGRDPLA